MRLTFPKSRRLYQRRDFVEVRDQGRRLAQGCMVINWMPAKPGKPWRLGIITTKALGPAVVRNRARRRIREAFRLNQGLLAHSADIVLIARSSIRNLDAARVTEDLVRALKRAGLLKT
jgi:ribonuclease P protein component